MARKRKTIEVKELLEHGNKLLALPKDAIYITKEWKAGVCSMLEKALHLSGNYNGFYHLNPDDCEINTFGYFSRRYL